MAESKNAKIAELQTLVDETKEQMTKNVENIVVRGSHIDEVNKRADQLADSADMFKQTADKVETKYRWKNRKMTLIIAAIVILILNNFFIIQPITTTF